MPEVVIEAEEIPTEEQARRRTLADRLRNSRGRRQETACGAGWPCAGNGGSRLGAEKVFRVGLRSSREKTWPLACGRSGWRTGQALVGNWRCPRCDPPTTSRRLTNKLPGCGGAQALPMKTTAVILDDLVDLAEDVAGAERAHASLRPPTRRARRVSRKPTAPTGIRCFVLRDGNMRQLGKDLRKTPVWQRLVPCFQGFLTRCGCPASEPVVSVLGDSLLAWQRGPAILTGVSLPTP